MAVKKKTTPFWLKMIIGMVLGALAGLAVSQHGLALATPDMVDAAKPWIMLPAKVFLTLIAMIVMPLVFTSVVLAVVSGGSFEFLKSTGLKICAYFVATTAMAVSVGLLVSNLIQPAKYVPKDLMAGAKAPASVAEIMGGEVKIPDLLAGLLPSNPFQMFLNQEMLQIVIVSALVGLAMIAIGKKAAPLTAVCESAQEISIKFVEWAMAIAPIAVFGFLFRLSVETGPEMFGALFAYISTVLLGLLLILGFYLFMVTYVAKRKPLEFLRQIRDAQVLAFSSSSSAATMPVSLKVAEENMKAKPEVAQLVIPLGATVNMDGTAMYQVVVAMFLTQLMGIHLDLGQMLLLSVTIIGASIGSPGTPGVGLVILATILAKIGVPPETIGIVLSVDRLLDMCRTTINVTGDLTATAVMDKLAKKKTKAA